MADDMQAVVFSRVGGAEELKFQRFPKPMPGPSQALIRVRACALNLLDYYLRIEEDPDMPMPHILGTDIAGVIEALGTCSTGIWKTGDEVIVSPALVRPDSSPGIVGYQIQGGYAEYCTVPESNLVRKPTSLTFEEASALPLAFVTAFHQVCTKGQIRLGDTVLISGGSGGVGTAAVQLCRAAGAWVVATAGTKEKQSALKELGADVVLNHNDADWIDAALKETNGQGFSLVCDNQGGIVLERWLELVSRGGRLVSVGSTSGANLQINVNSLFGKEISIIGSYLGTHEELQTVVKLVERGRVKPVVSKVFPLSDASEAHRFMESRQHFGKIVLKVS